MSMLWIAVLAVGVSPPDVSSPSTGSSLSSSAGSVAEVAPRSGRELEQATRGALRQWARAGDKEAKAAAVEFLTLYGELRQDKRLSAKTREDLRNKVRGRLANLALQISKIVAKESRAAKDKNAPKSVEIAKDEGVLAQWGGQANQGGGMGVFNGGMAGGANGAAGDAGQDLVDLIQKTISPTTWDVNGGPSAIYYWRPQRALVIAAPAEVHEQLSDMLEQMERMNR